MISSHCPDLVILDLGLPDMDGLDILRSLRSWTSLPVVVVSARSHERDKVAALDLGATPTYALTHVLIPECKQGIITGAMLAFTLSLDDFTISYFTTSPLVQNLSTLIYSAARKGIKPSLNALSALMFVSLLVLLLIVNRRTTEKK